MRQSGYFSFIVLRTTFFFLLKDLEQYQMMELKKEQEVMQVIYNWNRSIHQERMKETFNSSRGYLIGKIRSLDSKTRTSARTRLPNTK